MKNINKGCTKTFQKLVEMAIAADTEYPSIYIDTHNHNYGNGTGGIMGVSVQRLTSSDATWQQYSVAHYYKQNGDMIADPEMIFCFDVKKPEIIYPMYIKNGFFRERMSINFECDAPSTYNAREQADQNTFANIWLKNIKVQQNIK